MNENAEKIYSALLEHAQKGEDALSTLERILGERIQLVMLSVLRDGKVKEQAERLRFWVKENDRLRHNNSRLTIIIRELKKEIRNLKRGTKQKHAKRKISKR